jgi:alkylation response protein AidB-like acyl-CoA dehydrogenase
MRDRVARLWIEAESIRLASLRIRELQSLKQPGPDPNMTKLAYAQFLQRAYDTMMDIMGPEGALFPDQYEFKLHDEHLLDSHDPHWDFLGSRARTIAGGSSEVIKNVIGERVLGLPREAREDADKPYRDLFRGG